MDYTLWLVSEIRPDDDVGPSVWYTEEDAKWFRDWLNTVEGLNYAVNVLSFKTEVEFTAVLNALSALRVPVGTHEDLLRFTKEDDS